MPGSRYEPFLHMSVSIEPQYRFLSQHNKGIPFQRAKNSNHIQVWIQWLKGLWRFWNVVGDQKLLGGTKCWVLDGDGDDDGDGDGDGDGDDHHHADVTGASSISAAWCNFSFHPTLISTLAVKIRTQFSPKIIQILWWKLSGRNGAKRTGVIHWQS